MLIEHVIMPFGLFGGEGIKIMTKIEDIPEKCLAVKYLTDPYLINGKKIDLRLYALVTGFRPLRIYIYQDGIVRFASQNYNVNKNELDNMFIHLTNVCINRKFTPSGKTTKWLFKDFVKYLYPKNTWFSYYFPYYLSCISSLVHFAPFELKCFDFA